MKVKVIANFNGKLILGRCGIGNNGLRKYLASRVKSRNDPYVPMQSGTLKNQAQIASDGSMLIYSQPYAHYQYHGMVMAGRAPKHYTGKPLTYHGAPMRGPNWEKRMLADHVHDLEKDCAAYINARKGG